MLIFFILKLVDMLTSATCQPPSIDAKLSLKPGASPIREPFSCSLESDKHLCAAGGGSCRIDVDGYYIMNIVCIVIGAVTFIMYIRPRSLMLQSLPLKAWRLEGR